MGEEEKDNENKNRDQKACLSARSSWGIVLKVGNLNKDIFLLKMSHD